MERGQKSIESRLPSPLSPAGILSIVNPDIAWADFSHPPVRMNEHQDAMAASHWKSTRPSSC
jgi:hypothetical protein